jgi:lysozyme
MLSRHRVSRAALELIKRFEGYRQKAARLPDGRWTIGHGHTLTAREGAEVSETDAEALLVYDMIAVQHAVNENTLAPIGQNQFDALCSFAFNVGLDNFRRSQVLKRLNAGAAVQAACAMELWRKADFEGERIVVDALVRRRAAEKALFLTPDDGVFIAAPSPLLRPVIDLDALDLVPMRRPVEVQTSFEGERVTARRHDIPALGPDLRPEPQRDLPAEATPDPVPAVAAAAEAVTGRLSTLLADPGFEPGAESDVVIAAAAPFEADGELRPQADFGEPITVELDHEPERDNGFAAAATPAPAALQMEIEPEIEAEADSGLEIPQAPAARAFDEIEDEARPQVNLEMAPAEFIPARNRPPPVRRELSVVWYLLLLLFGLAFFGFAIFWGLNARPGAIGGIVTPLVVAWLAGLAGVGFAVVAVYGLLQRLGREAEQD